MAGAELPQLRRAGTLEEVVAFHGHLCPGLSMGVQAARVALKEIGPHARDEEVVAVVETDMCAVDAIQFLTGCTFGKGNLIHLDHGKNAYTFHRRADGRAVRIVGKPDAFTRDPTHQELFAKVRGGVATETEEAQFTSLHRAAAMDLLDMDPLELFEVTEVESQPPARARIHTSLVCAGCGEATMETRVRLLRGDHLCPPCFDAAIGGAG